MAVVFPLAFLFQNGTTSYRVGVKSGMYKANECLEIFRRSGFDLSVV